MKDKKLSKRKYRIRSKKQKHSRKRTQKKNKRSLKRKNTNRRTRLRNTRRNIHGGKNPFLKRERKKVNKIKKAEKADELKKRAYAARKERRRQWRRESGLVKSDGLDLSSSEKQKELVEGMKEEQNKIGNIMGGIDKRDNSEEYNMDSEGTSDISEQELEKIIKEQIFKSYKEKIPNFHSEDNPKIEPFIIEGEDGNLKRYFVDSESGILHPYIHGNTLLNVKTNNWTPPAGIL
tara:strand:- start:3832 stop:4533 length:702 start_codon:yes stop_codon:yes gene_type:complete